MITINFGGFYYSPDADYIDWAIESYNSDDQGEMLTGINDFIYDLSYDEFYLPLYELYCKDYIEVLNDILVLDLNFENIDSPKYYNFSTDVIIAGGLKAGDLFKLKRYIVDNDLQDAFKEHLKQVTTSYDGYAAFYSIDEIIVDEELYMMNILDVIIPTIDFISEFDMMNTYESIGVKSTDILYDKGFDHNKLVS